MEKYSRFEYEKILAILKKLKVAVEEVGIPTTLVDSSVKSRKPKPIYSIILSTFESEGDFNTIDFNGTTNKRINDDFSIESQLKKVPLLYADFFISGLDQPIATFEMRQSVSIFTVEIPDDDAIPVSIMPRDPSPDGFTSREWETALSDFIKFVTVFINDDINIIE